MANEAVFTLSKILLAHQDLLDFAPTMELSLQSGDIYAATKHWKKVTSIIQCTAVNLEEALKKLGSLSIAKRSIQQIKALTNISLKKELAKSSTKRNPHDARLDGLMEDNNPVPDIVPRPPSKRIKHNTRTLEGAVKDLFAKHPPGEDKTLYSMRELVQYMCDDAINSPVFKLPVEKVYDVLKNSSTFTVACSCKTLKRKIAKYNKNRELPPLHDFGVAVGRKPLVPDNNIPQLVDGLSSSAGRAQTPHEFSTRLVEVNQNLRVERGLPLSLQPPLPSEKTLDWYRRCVCVHPEANVTPVLSTSVRGQEWKRDVAMHSFRNVLAQAATVIAHHFVPGEWNPPTYLPEGAIKAHQLAEYAYGKSMKPKDPWQIINYDMTQQYVWKGTADNSSRNKWMLVDSDYVNKRSKEERSLFGPDSGGSFNGVTARWCDGIVASGHVLPFVLIFSSWDEKVMPTLPNDDKPMIVLEIPGFCMGSQLIPGRLEPGYVVLLRKGTSMKGFHRWYQDQILYKTYITLRNEYCPTGSAELIPQDEMALTWFDSDMTNTKETSSDEAVMKNQGRGMQFLKFGAKTTGMWQPCDVGEGFKTMKAACKKTTVTIDDAALEQRVKQRLTQLRNQGRFLLDGCKLDAMVDCVATAPHTKNDAYSKKNNKMAFVRSGMLSSESEPCPNLYKIMQKSSIKWDSNQLLRQQFLDALPQCITEIIHHGFISEKVFDDLGIPKDKDRHGHDVERHGQSDVFGRAMAISTERTLISRQTKMIQDLEDQRHERIRKLRLYDGILGDADTCQEQLQKMADEKNIKISELALEDFQKLKRDYLKAFVGVRTQKDLRIPLKSLNKGTAEDVRGGKINCLVYKAKEVADQPVIAERPDIPVPQLPQPMGFSSVEVMKFIQTELQPLNISIDFINKAFQSVKSLSVSNARRSDHTSPAGMAQLEKHTNILAKMLKYRLSLFLRHRLPSDRWDLLPGNHWVWDSFIVHLPKIACLMLMSDVHAPNFVNRKDIESLLGKSDKFKAVCGSGLEKCDGCYLHLDKNRSEIVRSGQTAAGFEKRQKEHEKSSKLQDGATKTRLFYQSYPHPTVADSVDGKRGLWSDLEQVVGIGVAWHQRQSVIDLFDWTESETECLSKLKDGAKGGLSIQSKQYKHLCYLFETCFAVAISSQMNVTMNPTCEWQLRWYGKK
jgi:hypothetical protein